MILFAFSLFACRGNVDIATTEDLSVLDNVYTSVAITLTAQAGSFTPTSTPSPSASPTITTSPTATPITPTAQNDVAYSSYSTANGCNDAIYISDVTIPDGTILAPAVEFVKTWKFQNTGSCGWYEDYLLTFVNGEDMDGNDTIIDASVPAGETASISVSLVSPEVVGTYTGYWRLSDEDGNAFGQLVYVMIVVSDDASTSTPTQTATSTPGVTATQTSPSVSTATFTLAATATPTSTPTPTPTPFDTVTPTLTPVPTSTSTPISDGSATP